MTITGDSTTDGAAELTNGEFSVTQNEYIGQSGVGHFVQTAGIHTVGYNLRLGDEFLSQGTYEFQGGTLTVAGPVDWPEVTAWGEHIGSNGRGTFRQTGGVHDIYVQLVIGTGSDADGKYELIDGTLHVCGIYSRLQYRDWGPETIEARGSFMQTGGVHIVEDTLNVRGTYMLLSGELSVGQSETITGAFTQTGGRHIVGDTFEVSSNHGENGTYEQSGGTTTVKYLSVANGARYSFTGGNLEVRRGMKVDGKFDFGGEDATVNVLESTVLGFSESDFLNAENASFCRGYPKLPYKANIPVMSKD